MSQPQITNFLEIQQFYSSETIKSNDLYILFQFDINHYFPFSWHLIQ